MVDSVTGRCRALWAAARLMLLVALPAGCVAAAGAGCAEGQSEPMVLLVIDVEDRGWMPGEIDAIRVTITAGSRPGGPPTCQPVERVFGRDVVLGRDAALSASDLPIRVGYAPGPEFDSWVAFRVVWSKNDLPQQQRLLLVSLPESLAGADERHMTLERTCIHHAACDSGEQCVDGSCAMVSGWPEDLFDPGWFSGQPPCEAAAADAGADAFDGDPDGADAGPDAGDAQRDESDATS